jgi:preprotein translocase subunit SecF
MSSLGNRLYTGESEIDFVGRRKQWAIISAVLLGVSILSFFVPGLNFGIDFKGGSLFEAQSNRPVTEDQIRAAVPEAEIVQLTDGNRVRVQTETLTQEQVASARSALTELTGDSSIETRAVGSKWGSTVSEKALIALVVFLIVTVIYVTIRFEFKMAIAALLALAHDLIITAGIYALSGFEVTPSTVIALLTILGYSLYDTMVVFDKVRENTSALSSLSRTTYSDLANRAVNQTAVRSLNTSVISILPVAGLLFVGAFALGAETLKDLALALFIGLAVGAYSSIFVATPFLAAWKEREPRNQQIRARQATLANRAAGKERTPAGAAAGGQARPGGTRPQRRVRTAEPEAMPMPDLAPDPVDGLDDDDADAPAATGSTGNRPRPSGTGQRKGSAQARRRSGGRQPSRPAKRRRR